MADQNAKSDSIYIKLGTYLQLELVNYECKLKIKNVKLKCIIDLT